ncbi:hypothetical protein FZC76_20610 [Sutcliffiella horikoshii]|uniref:Uncharacterized protein n=2 Tax=Sutcliffiella horikoshii TaxID=79883 RepID=A0A5D4SFW2_9BACI|nr:hypothetical protein FZC76_20610 [Sutcliffiella horikoshii]
MDNSFFMIGGVYMNYEHIKELKILNAALIIGGLVLMFLSVTFGTAIGDSWLDGVGGMADTSNYERIVDTQTNNFVIIGSILFGAGVLTSLGTFYFSARYIKGEEE